MKEPDLAGVLGTSGRDTGCDEAFAVLDEFVEVELGGRDVHALLPAVAEHLRNCAACREDHAALLALARERPDT